MSRGIPMAAVLDSGKVRSKKSVDGYSNGSGSKGEVILSHLFGVGCSWGPIFFLPMGGDELREGAAWVDFLRSSFSEGWGVRFRSEEFFF